MKKKISSVPIFNKNYKWNRTRDCPKCIGFIFPKDPTMGGFCLIKQQYGDLINIIIDRCGFEILKDEE